MTQPSLTVRFAAASHVGLLRDGNEDSAYAGPHLLVVADGMGGAAAGEVASSVAVAALARLDDDEPRGDLLAALRETLERAEHQLAALVDAEPKLTGMGTTVTALLRSGSRLGLLHVGDSRAYLLRDGSLEPITRDHTLVQSLVDAGRLTEAEARTHPQRNVLTRVLDGAHSVPPDLSLREIHPGDRLLLCSDGLSGVVSHETLQQALVEQTDPQAATETLVELALRAGGPDNVTCVVADIAPAADTNGPTPPPVAVGAVGAGRRTRRVGLPDTPAGRAAALVDGSAAAPVVRSTRRRRRRLILLTGLVTLLLGLTVGALASWYVWARQQYYVGEVEQGGQAVVAVYRGPADGLFGLDLSELVRATDLAVASLPEFEQDQVASTIPARSGEDADEIVTRLYELAATCEAPNPPTGCPGAS